MAHPVLAAVTWEGEPGVSQMVSSLGSVAPEMIPNKPPLTLGSHAHFSMHKVGTTDLPASYNFAISVSVV